MQLQERDSLSWVLKALREAGNSLMSELSRVDETAFSTRPAEGELSLKEIAAHLRDAEELASRQMASLVDDPRRSLPFWDIDLLPLERDYQAGNVGRVLAEFRGLRGETTQLLWGVTGAEWRRRGKHPYRGDITLETIARELAQHDLEHLWQVRRLKHELGVTGSTPRDEWDW